MGHGFHIYVSLMEGNSQLICTVMVLNRATSNGIITLATKVAYHYKPVTHVKGYNCRIVLFQFVLMLFESNNQLINLLMNLEAPSNKYNQIPLVM